MALAEATRVVAIRHGETDWNARSRVQGQLDIALNAAGRRQAQRLAAALAGEPLAAVYSSDLSRARETAEAIAAAAGLDVTIDAALRERGFGRFEGMTFLQVEQRWPDDALRWRTREPGFGPGGGETLSAFYDRAVAAATALAARHPGQAIALVTHGGVLDCLYRAATRAALQAPRSWQLRNAAINRLLYGGEGFVLVGWCDAAHLDAGSGSDRAVEAA